MGKLKYLSKNLALFSISNFVSKILVFLLVPLYTNVLSTYEYGVADIIQVTILLLVPAVTMNVGEAALRFGIELPDKRGSIFRTGTKYIVRASAFIAVVCTVAMFFVSLEIKKYVFLFIFLFAANSLFEFLVLYFQGCEIVQIVVTGSVFSTIVTISSNIIFLLVLKAGLNGYILSQIISYTLASALMIIIGKFAKVLKESKYDTELEKEMLEYSKPMIVYTTAGWVNNAADRYLVAGMCGAAVNGLYGVAYKIPAILMVFQRIFAQAWQMSATKTYDDDKSDVFFTGMFKAYNTFMVIGCSILIILVRPIAVFLYRRDFYEAWRLVPPLLISVIFGALTGFFGSICLAHKDSKSMGIATGIGATINVVLNVALIPRFSAMGAAVATGISYFVMALLAYIFVSKYVNLSLNIWKLLISYILVAVQSVLMIMNIKFDYLYSALIIIVLIIISSRDLIDLFKIVKIKIVKKGSENV